MQPLIRREFDGFVATVAHTTRDDGDLSPSSVPAVVLADRRNALVPHPWCALKQVHSDRVIVATGTPSPTRPCADALVTTKPDLVLAVHSGDCVPVGLVTSGGAIGAVHAGWKGLEAGVLESTARLLRQQARGIEVVAAIGPHIRVGRYEFGERDLDRLIRRFGDDVAGLTDGGHAALDLTAAVRSELRRLDIEIVAQSPDCTAALSERYWSHRARQEPGRIALVAWLEADAVGSRP